MRMSSVFFAVAAVLAASAAVLNLLAGKQVMAAAMTVLLAVDIFACAVCWRS